MLNVPTLPFMLVLTNGLLACSLWVAIGPGRINDTYGHQTGDAVLKHFVRVVQGCLRKRDLLARYGGEEFCVLVPDAGADATESLAERIRAEVEAGTYRDGATSLTLTASAGVASLQPADGAIASLTQRADDALYAAKRDGRNRVTMAA